MKTPLARPATGLFEEIHLIFLKITAAAALLAGLLGLAAALAAVAAAQEPLSISRVFTNPPGVPFEVDGQLYRGPASFNWPKGSKHILSTGPLQDGVNARTRFVFSKWMADTTEILPMTNTVVITADPAISQFQAVFKVEYALQLNFFECPSLPCESPGTVYVDRDQYSSSVELWKERGKIITLQAVPAPGYVFLGWYSGNGNVTQGFINTVTMNSPVEANPRFTVARRVRLETVPPNLSVVVDRATVPTPANLDWGFNTTHTLAPLSPQDNVDGLWIFDSWAHGGSATQAYTVPPGGNDLVITARFVAGARATFLTSPPGLKLQVDGRENWMAYSFSWGVGEKHRVAAAAQQTDAAGRPWRFREWSNGGPAEQEVTIAEQHVEAGYRLTAFYDPLGRVRIQTSAPGIPIRVDGAECPAPCQVDRPMGARLLVSVPASVPVREGARLDFQGWEDGSGAERTLVVSAASHTLTAAYQTLHRLDLAAEPPEGVRWRLAPESPDRFYPAQQQVAVAAEARPGYRFVRWGGDLSGTYAAGTVAMTGPRAVQALLDPVPFIPPTGVRNAAAETPEPVVAAGSVIAILGVNLAPWPEGGPESPLVQTIAGVTVRLGARLLPLFSVAPGQINALLPSDVEEGPQALAVKWEGKPEARAEAMVMRNAPGLFAREAEGQVLAVASHEDGSAVTPEAPARAGEEIAVYGTGFGPYLRTPPDGFAVPASPAYPLADAVELVAGEAVLAPEFAGAAAGRVGITVLRFRVDAAMPAGLVELKVRVNGRESNTVKLPVAGGA